GGEQAPLRDHESRRPWRFGCSGVAGRSQCSRRCAGPVFRAPDPDGSGAVRTGDAAEPMRLVPREGEVVSEMTPSTAMSADEFAGIFAPSADRDVMSRPPRVLASRAFIGEVREALAIVDDDAAREAADWIAD